MNAQPAIVTKLGPTGPWRFQKELDLPAGQTTITVQAKDGANNITPLLNYAVTVGNGPERTLEYDTNGNLTKMRNSAGVVIRLCEWDAVNQLLAVQSAEVLVAGVKRTEFSYDGGGRRVRQIEKEHNGTIWITQCDWTYIWDGLELVQRRNTSDGTVLKNYFSSGECGAGLPPTDAIVYQTDHLGSVRSWYRVSDGQRGEADFTAYGERTITTTGPGIPERGYTGHLHHSASGLILAPFRAYDAELGRWISEDPLGEDGGINLYRYANNSPGMYIDRDGRFPMLIPIVIGALFGGAATAWAPTPSTDTSVLPPSQFNPFDFVGPGGLGKVCYTRAASANALRHVVRALAPVAKFSDYIFKPGATHGKDAVFRSLGYTAKDSAKLAQMWEKQASAKFAKGDYTMGKLDEFGQRINIVINVPGVGAAKGKCSSMISGWMIRSDGTITLNTPFSGHP